MKLKREEALDSELAGRPVCRRLAGRGWAGQRLASSGAYKELAEGALSCVSAGLLAIVGYS